MVWKRDPKNERTVFFAAATRPRGNFLHKRKKRKNGRRRTSKLAQTPEKRSVRDLATPAFIVGSVIASRVIRYIGLGGPRMASSLKTPPPLHHTQITMGVLDVVPVSPAAVSVRPPAHRTHRSRLVSSPATMSASSSSTRRPTRYVSVRTHPGYMLTYISTVRHPRAYPHRRV